MIVASAAAADAAAADDDDADGPCLIESWLSALQLQPGT